MPPRRALSGPCRTSRASLSNLPALSSPASRAPRAFLVSLACVLALPLLLFGAAAGCGKKLPPEPPILVLPARPQPVTLTQEGTEVILRFPFPTRTVTGEPLTSLSKVTVWREVIGSPAGGPLPLAPEKASDREREERLFLQRAERRMELSPRDLDERSWGSELIVRDSLRDLFDSRRLGKVILRYGVSATRTKRKTSELSPLVAIRPVAPPDAPRNVRAVAEEGRVCLEWDPPPAGEEGRAPAKVYAVYRRLAPPPGVADDGWYERILSGTPVPSYVDTGVETGKRYLYVVRAAPGDQPPYILGPPSEEVLVDTRDVFPPGSPEGLLALREIGGVRLLWSPVLAPDLASYEVLRRRRDGTWESAARSLTEPTWFDAKAPDGETAYGVLAVDRSGNRGVPTEALAPPAGERERR